MKAVRSTHCHKDDILVSVFWNIIAFGSNLDLLPKEENKITVTDMIFTRKWSEKEEMDWMESFYGDTSKGKTMGIKWEQQYVG